MPSLAGKILVALPDLDDPNFRQTVVLVVDHDDEGAFGLVLNRPSTTMLKAVWEQWTQEPCSIDSPLMVGGPVQGPLSALHADPALSEHEVIPGVYLARDRDLLTSLVAAEAQPLRIFVGYSGWGSGQLEAELETGSWSVTAATPDFVFGDPSSLWARATRRIADDRLLASLRVLHSPARPEEN